MKVDNLNFAAKVFNKKKINDNEKAHTLKVKSYYILDSIA